jgi:hypothetical protein
MTATAYTSLGIEPLPGSIYEMRYEFDEVSGSAGGNGRGWGTSRTYTDGGLTGDTTYSYQVRMGLFYNDPDDDPDEGWIPAEEGPWSGTASVVIEALPLVDTFPPLPNPAEHDSGSPFQKLVVDNSGVDQWYHVVTAVIATDIDENGETLPENENVEYKFVCSNSTFNSGNNSGGLGDPDEIEWRNVDNVAGLTYADGITPQVPQEYWARRALRDKYETWYIIVRDRSPRRNPAGQSQARSILTPAP